MFSVSLIQMFVLPGSRWIWAGSRTRPSPCRRSSPAPPRCILRCRRRARPPPPSADPSTSQQGAASPRSLTAATTAAWPDRSTPFTTGWVQASPTPDDVILSDRWVLRFRIGSVQNITPTRHRLAWQQVELWCHHHRLLLTWLSFTFIICVFCRFSLVYCVWRSFTLNLCCHQKTNQTSNSPSNIYFLAFILNLHQNKPWNLWRWALHLKLTFFSASPSCFSVFHIDPGGTVSHDRCVFSSA